MAGEYFESDSCDQCGDTEVGVIVFEDTKGYGVASVCWQCLLGALDTLHNGELDTLHDGELEYVRRCFGIGKKTGKERCGVASGGPTMIQVTCVCRNDVGAIYEVPELQLQYSWVTTPEGPFVVLRPNFGEADPVHDQGDENWVWYGEEAAAIRDSLEAAINH